MIVVYLTDSSLKTAAAVKNSYIYNCLSYL